jgi:hypothetical protein
MLKVRREVKKFGKKGEKTNWTYLEIEADLAQKINKGVKKLYKVKGLINGIPFRQTNLTPMGEGNYILSINAELRRKLKLNIGDMVTLNIEVDLEVYTLNDDLMACLAEDSTALLQFNKIPAGEQRYFSKWVDAAKTLETSSRRIASILNAMHKKLGYAEMIRQSKKESE